jgi:uncharacterized protein (TIGR04222 family)
VRITGGPHPHGALPSSPRIDVTFDQRKLWERVQSHALDDPEAAQPFSLRLAKEHHWAPGFTQRAMVEYLRFAFIATAGGHPVAPSHVVDQVWHLHLLHTRDYWGVFCPQVLGGPLHHGPARGGGEEKKKFADWYTQTLTSYRRFFGEPPADIWPEPATQPRTRYVATDRHWIIRKPQWLLSLSAALRALYRRGGFVRTALRPKPGAPAREARPRNSMGGAGLIVLLLGLAHAPSIARAATTAASDPPWPFDLKGPEFLVFFIILAAVLFTVAVWLRWWTGGNSVRGGLALDLSPYDVAELADGHGRAFVAAVAHLHYFGHVVVRNNAIVLGTLSLPRGRPLLERAIVGACTATGTPIATVREAAEDAMDEIAAGLAERGLVVRSDSYAHVSALVVALIVPVIGLIKIVIGSARNKPVGILALLTFGAAWLALAVFARRPRRTRQGHERVRQLEAEHVDLRTWSRSGSSSDPALAVGLFGLDVLENSHLDAVRGELHRVPTGDRSAGSSCSSSSCSSSSSSDSGGGSSCGGGGCGGCGGGD